MQFSSLLLGLTIATSIFAAPAEIVAPVTALEERQTSVAGTITSIVGTLNTTVNSNLVSINKLVTGVNGNVGASIAIVANITANLDGIKAAFKTATAAIIGATTNGVGGLVGTATGFTQAQVNELVAALVTIVKLVQNIQVTFQLIITNLAPAAFIAVRGTLLQVVTLIAPLIGPLTVFATAVSNASASASLTVTGLQAAINGIGNVVATFLTGLLGL